MLTGARRRARFSGFECSIKISDIHVPEYCPILGIRLVVNENFGGDDSPTLDRVNVNKGYIKGNICVISSRANRIKNDATRGEVEAVLRYIDSFGDT